MSRSSHGDRFSDRADRNPNGSVRQAQLAEFVRDSTVQMRSPSGVLCTCLLCHSPDHLDQPFCIKTRSHDGLSQASFEYSQVAQKLVDAPTPLFRTPFGIDHRCDPQLSRRHFRLSLLRLNHGKLQT